MTAREANLLADLKFYQGLAEDRGIELASVQTTLDSVRKQLKAADEEVKRLHSMPASSGGCE